MGPVSFGTQASRRGAILSLKLQQPRVLVATFYKLWLEGLPASSLPDLDTRREGREGGREGGLGWSENKVVNRNNLQKQ